MKYKSVKGYTLGQLRRKSFKNCRSILEEFTTEELDRLHDGAVFSKTFEKFDNDFLRFRATKMNPIFSFYREECNSLQIFNEKLKDAIDILICRINYYLEFSKDCIIEGNVKPVLPVPRNEKISSPKTGIYSLINRLIKPEVWILLMPEYPGYSLLCAEENYEKTITSSIAINDIPYLVYKKLYSDDLYVSEAFDRIIGTEIISFADLINVMEIEISVQVDDYTRIKVRD